MWYVPHYAVQSVIRYLQLQDADGAFPHLLLHVGIEETRTTGTHQPSLHLETHRMVEGCPPGEHLWRNEGEAQEGRSAHNHLGHQGRRRESQGRRLGAHPPAHLLQSGPILRPQHDSLPHPARADPPLCQATHRSPKIHIEICKGYHRSVSEPV